MPVIPGKPGEIPALNMHVVEYIQQNGQTARLIARPVSNPRPGSQNWAFDFSRTGKEATEFRDKESADYMLEVSSRHFRGPDYAGCEFTASVVSL